MAAARERQANLTKPAGALGRLETLSIQLAGITGVLRPALRPARVERPVADRDLLPPILALALRQSWIGQGLAQRVRPLTQRRLPD